MLKQMSMFGIICEVFANLFHNIQSTRGDYSRDIIRKYTSI